MSNPTYPEGGRPSFKPSEHHNKSVRSWPARVRETEDSRFQLLLKREIARQEKESKEKEGEYLPGAKELVGLQEVPPSVSAELDTGRFLLDQQLIDYYDTPVKALGSRVQALWNTDPGMPLDPKQELEQQGFIDIKPSQRIKKQNGRRVLGFGKGDLEVIQPLSDISWKTVTHQENITTSYNSKMFFNEKGDVSSISTRFKTGGEEPEAPDVELRIAEGITGKTIKLEWSHAVLPPTLIDLSRGRKALKQIVQDTDLNPIGTQPTTSHRSIELRIPNGNIDIRNIKVHLTHGAGSVSLGFSEARGKFGYNNPSSGHLVEYTPEQIHQLFMTMIGFVPTFPIQEGNSLREFLVGRDQIIPEPFPSQDEEDKGLEQYLRNVGNKS